MYDKRLNKRVQVWMSLVQFNKLKELAKSEGLDASNFIRNRLFSQNKAERLISNLIEELKNAKSK